MLILKQPVFRWRMSLLPTAWKLQILLQQNNISYFVLNSKITYEESLPVVSLCSASKYSLLAMVKTKLWRKSLGTCKVLGPSGKQSRRLCSFNRSFQVMLRASGCTLRLHSVNFICTHKPPRHGPYLQDPESASLAFLDDTIRSTNLVPAARHSAPLWETGQKAPRC